MAKDDYHVVVYQILSYLYQCLKKGKKVEAKYLSQYNEHFQLENEDYWRYILYNMQRQYLIEGITFTEVNGVNIPFVAGLENAQITPIGIEYLCDNKFIEKAEQFLKDVKEITPFI